MRYFLETNQTIKMPKSAENTIAEEILSNYTFGRKWNIEYTNDNCITIGNYKKADSCTDRKIRSVFDGCRRNTNGYVYTFK